MSGSSQISFHDYGNKKGFRIFDVSLPGDNKIITITCWFREGSSITTANVVFTEEQEKMPVPNLTAVLSLKEAKSHQEVKKSLIVFQKVMETNRFTNISYRFFVANQNQKDIVAAIGQELRILYIIKDVNQKEELTSTHNQSPKNPNLRVVNTTPSKTSQNVIEVYEQGDWLLDVTNNDLVGIIGQGCRKIGNEFYRDGEQKPFAVVMKNEQIDKTVTESAKSDAKSLTRRPVGGQVQPIITQPSGPIGRGTGRSAAFVNLPMIMFVLSALLLLGSVILLFVLD